MIWLPHIRLLKQPALDQAGISCIWGIHFQISITKCFRKCYKITTPTNLGSRNRLAYSKFTKMINFGHHGAFLGVK